jgi:hypothetical protein
LTASFRVFSRASQADLTPAVIAGVDLPESSFFHRRVISTEFVQVNNEPAPTGLALDNPGLFVFKPQAQDCLPKGCLQFGWGLIAAGLEVNFLHFSATFQD